MPYDSARSLYQLVRFSQVYFWGRRKKTYRRKPTPRERFAYTPEDEGVGALNLKV
jgi:hypothetical protein